MITAKIRKLNEGCLDYWGAGSKTCTLTLQMRLLRAKALAMTRIASQGLATTILLLCTLHFALCTLHSFNLDYRQSQAGSGYPGEYLYNFSANVRNLALGKAGVADGDNATVSYWNPAYLRPGRVDLYLFYSNSFYNTKFNFLGSSFDLNNLFTSQKKLGTIGLSFTGMESGDFEKTSALGENLGSFSIIDRAYKISYSNLLPKGRGIVYGVGLNYIEQAIDLVRGSVLGADLGFGYSLKEQLFLGLTFQNINTPRLRSDRYPLNAKSGLMLSPFKKDILRVLFDYDVINLFGPGGISNKWHSGLELRPSKYFDLRLGADYKELSAGLGIKYRGLRLDYAWTQHELEQNHRVGVLIDFDLPDREEDPEKKKLREEREREKVEAGKKEQIEKEKTDREESQAREKAAREEEEKAKKLQEEKQKAEKTREINKMLDEAKQNLDSKNYSAAKDLYEKILGMESSNQQAKQSLVNTLLLLKAENKKQDTTLFDEALLSDNQPELQRLLAKIRKDYPELLEEIRKTKYEAAIKNTEATKYDEALKNIGHILTIEPGQAQAVELKKKVEELKALFE